MLEGVKVGDKLTVLGGYSGKPEMITTVERLTKTKVVTRRYEFEYGGGLWGCRSEKWGQCRNPRARFVKDGDEEFLRKKLLAGNLNKMEFNKLPLHVIEEIYQLATGSYAEGNGG